MSSKPLYYTLFALTTTTTLTYLLTRPKRTLPPPEFPLHGSANCRYPLDASHSHTFTLSSGRVLGYADYGDPNGRVILYQHGLPGSRIEAARYHELGKELGIRVIAVDRPGYGLSSPMDGYKSSTVGDWAGDVGELVAKLRVRECAVMGVSGGGPYALTLAHLLPACPVRALCIICGIGPPDLSMRGAAWPTYLGFTVGWRWSPPFLLRWFFRRDAATALELSDEQRLRILLSPDRLQGLNEADRAFFADEDEMRVYVAASREAFRQGYDAMCQDGYKLCVDWGFRVEDVRKDVPVVMWYGAQDVNVPPEHGRAVAGRLRMEEERGDEEVSEKGEVQWRERVRLRMLDDTHASVSMRDKKGYMVELMKAWDAGVGGEGEKV
ncbi:Proline iminopeptidase 3 [Stagonosporopsis vannaccii]|nr:Proline iminopeptidase 3 [Stagonosporopsis vannaccii]